MSRDWVDRLAQEAADAALSDLHRWLTENRDLLVSRYIDVHKRQSKESGLSEEGRKNILYVYRLS